jgi:hypothetical protein
MYDQLVTFGILLPEDLMHAKWFGVLAAFVALNTVMYVTLAISKALPKVYITDWLPRRYQRAETRSIHPDGAA